MRRSRGYGGRFGMLNGLSSLITVLAVILRSHE